MLPTKLPPELIPTRFQRERAHPAWIDAVPSPRWRDSLILATENGSYDEEELCMNVMGAMYGNSGNNGEFEGVMVRGEPWSVTGWEMTEGFVRKWGFLMEECPELVEATNRWRLGRGERPLIVSSRVEEIE